MSGLQDRIASLRGEADFLFSEVVNGNGLPHTETTLIIKGVLEILKGIEERLTRLEQEAKP